MVLHAACLLCRPAVLCCGMQPAVPYGLPFHGHAHPLCPSAQLTRRCASGALSPFHLQSLQTIVFLHCFHALHPNSCSLVIVPKNVKINWHDEFKKWLPMPLLDQEEGFAGLTPRRVSRAQPWVAVERCGWVVRAWNTGCEGVRACSAMPPAPC